MNLSLSLKTKITIVFSFLFLLLIFISFPLHTMQERKADEQTAQNYERLVHSIREKRLLFKETQEYLKSLKFVRVEKPHEILDRAKVRIRRRGFELYVMHEKYYLHILTPYYRLLVEDTSKKPEQSYSDIFILLLLALFFAFIYYLIIKNINDTQHQLKSRQLFLRTVMHELKTPISKGRIVSELIDDEKQKNRMITIFEKLNLLIDDFAKVEQVTSRNYNLTIHSYTLKSIIERAIEMLMLENRENINIENLSNSKINVDKELFAMALKNLIDNALKYSIDSKVVLKEQDGALLVISKGEKILKPIETYFQAFHNDTQGKNHGMGLGLYIVNTIVQMHHAKLSYEHRNTENIFKIILAKNDSTKRA